MPRILKRICAFLKTSDLQFRAQSPDGRLASAAHEQQVIDLLLGKFPNRINVPPSPRYWYDFAAVERGILVPVNIKISALGNQADNLSCKLGMYYALTGLEPDFANEIPWEKYLSKLADRIRRNDRDYYFLVVNKRQPSDIFAVGLKEIANLRPNGSNLPFQCRWKDNMVPQVRPYAEAKRYIIEQFRTSINLRTLKSEKYIARILEVEN